MRAVIYARVSSDRQRERHTIGSQLSELPMLVKREGWTLIETLVDDGISGETVEARPGFLRVLDLAEQRAFDVLVVIDLDRITRARNSAEGAIIFDTLRECKVKISTPQQGPIDLEDENQDFFVGLLREVAKWDKRKTVRRMQRGMRESVRRNGRYHCIDPYGFRWIPDSTLASRGSYQHDPAQAAIIRQMVKWAVDGMTALKIMERLNAEGHKAKRGGEWSYASVQKILRSTTIKGEFRVMKKVGGETLRLPPIVSSETWLRLQAVLDGRHSLRSKRRPTLGEYLLSGLVKCGECGYAMWIARPNSGSRYSYYRCSTTNLWRQLRLSGPCHNRHHRTEGVDADVWKHVQALIVSPDLLAQACSIGGTREERGVNWEVQAQQCRAKLSTLEDLEAEVLGRRRRQLISAAACDRELASIASERGTVERTLYVAEDQIAGGRQATARLAEIREYATKLGARVARMTFAEKIRLVSLLVAPPKGSVRIHTNGDIEFRGAIALSNEEVEFSTAVERVKAV